MAQRFAAWLAVLQGTRWLEDLLLEAWIHFSQGNQDWILLVLGLESLQGLASVKVSLGEKPWSQCEFCSLPSSAGERLAWCQGSGHWEHCLVYRARNVNHRSELAARWHFSLHVFIKPLSRHQIINPV